LQTAVAAYRVLRFAIPRPLALLGQQHFDRLIREIDQIRSRWPRDRFTSFRLSAAGADSAVFRRIKDAISQRTGLADSATEGDLAINVRRTAGENAGWDVLLRLSPRPLSARLWRVCNWPGALNATVARVMVGLARPSPSERFLNLACGSGTLLIERLADGPGGLAIGIDRDEAALDCARANLSAAAQTGAALIQADVRRLPLPDRSFDTLVADLPFGMRFGSTRENAELYPATLGEAARVAVPAATLVVITADIRSLRSAVDQTKTLWHLERDLPIALSYPSGYIHPHIVILRRNHLL
jgi:23S rRNA G2445 N2-methylase RlmL